MYHYKRRNAAQIKEAIRNAFGNLNRTKLNLFAAAMSGLLFFTGWWLLIDISVVHKEFMKNCKLYHIPGVVGTIAMVVVNMIPNRVVHREYGEWSVTAILFLFVGFVLAFGALIGATYILVHDFLMTETEDFHAGLAIFIQNLLIFVANLVAKFGTKNVERF